QTIDLTQPFQFADASGRPVGTFLPEAKLRELIAERDSLRKELEDLRKALDEVTAERNDYRRGRISSLPPEEFTLTAEDLKDMEKNGYTMEQILADIESLDRPGTEHA